MISINGKDTKVCIKNMSVWNSFEKMKLQLCFFFKKPSLVSVCNDVLLLNPLYKSYFRVMIVTVNCVLNKHNHGLPLKIV